MPQQRSNIPRLRVQNQPFVLRGGENLETPAIELNPGELTFSQNYEARIRGGYRRIDGYERFDGQLKPSEALPTQPAGCSGLMFAFENLYPTTTFPGYDSTPVLPATLTLWIRPFGETSVLVGEVQCLIDDETDPGTWGGTSGNGWNGQVVWTWDDQTEADEYAVLLMQDPEQTYLTWMEITDQNGNKWETADYPGLVPSKITKISDVPNPFDDDFSGGDPDPGWVPTEQEKIDAIEAARAAITPVPGAGAVRGIWFFHNNAYAVRDDVPGLNGFLYRSTPTGWELEDLGFTIPFTGGNLVVLEGDTITGASSGAVGTVSGIDTLSGSWSAGTAAGNIYVKVTSGTFGTSEAVNATGGSFNTNGAATANQLSAEGVYRFITHNFFGNESGEAFYAVNGIDRAWKFNENGFAWITTGSSPDAPTFVEAHRGYLFLAFRGGSLQHSEPGSPFGWNGANGASEIGLGYNTTGLESLPGSVLGIWSRDKIQLLYGRSIDDWDLKLHSKNVGAIENTVTTMGSPRFLDDRGLTSLDATDAYGDFTAGTLSTAIQPLLQEFKVDVTQSIEVSSKAQYRLFRSDGFGLIATFTDQGVAFTRFQYPIVVRCVCASEDYDGKEVIFCGSDDGYIYQLDSGTSFDGTAIDAYLRLAFNHMGLPQAIKGFKKAVFDVTAPEPFDLYYVPDFSYGEAEHAASQEQSANMYPSGGYWGSAVWLDFQWSGPAVGRAVAYIDGSGINLGIAIRTSDAYKRSHTIHAANVYYTVRAPRR